MGVDPGLASTGVAVVGGTPSRPRALEWGTITTKPATPHADRLAQLAAGVAAVLSRHDVDGAAIEGWFVHPMSRSAMAMAEARGAILATLAGAGVPVVEYSPNAIKQAVTGSGRADKEQVRVMVSRLTGAEVRGSHAADALAAALCHLVGSPVREAIRRAE